MSRLTSGLMEVAREAIRSELRKGGTWEFALFSRDGVELSYLHYERQTWIEGAKKVWFAQYFGPRVRFAFVLFRDGVEMHLLYPNPDGPLESGATPLVENLPTRREDFLFLIG